MSEHVSVSVHTRAGGMQGGGRAAEVALCSPAFQVLGGRLRAWAWSRKETGSGKSLHKTPPEIFMSKKTQGAGLGSPALLSPLTTPLVSTEGKWKQMSGERPRAKQAVWRRLWPRQRRNEEEEGRGRDGGGETDTSRPESWGPGGGAGRAGGWRAQPAEQPRRGGPGFALSGSCAPPSPRGEATLSLPGQAHF